MATLCDNTDPDNTNDCPLAGARLVATLSGGPGPDDDLDYDDLMDMHKGLHAILMEFTNEGTLLVNIENDPGKGPPPIPVPTLSEWGLAAMALLLASTGVIIICRRRGTPPKPFHSLAVDTPAHAGSDSSGHHRRRRG